MVTKGKTPLTRVRLGNTRTPWARVTDTKSRGPLARDGIMMGKAPCSKFRLRVERAPWVQVRFSKDRLHPDRVTKGRSLLARVRLEVSTAPLAWLRVTTIRGSSGRVRFGISEGSQAWVRITKGRAVVG